MISGTVEPSGLLSFQMPKDMQTVFEQEEDVPRDMDPYVDADGNSYDFCFGLNWSGVIDDEAHQDLQGRPRLRSPRRKRSRPTPSPLFSLLPAGSLGGRRPFFRPRAAES